MTVFHHVKRDPNSPFVTLYVCLPSVATFAFLRSSYACIMRNLTTRVTALRKFKLKMHSEFRRAQHCIRSQTAKLEKLSK